MLGQIDDVLAVGGTYAHGVFVVLQVVVLLSQGHTTLEKVHDVVLRVFLIGSDIEREESIDPLAHHAGPHLLYPLLGSPRAAVAVTGQEGSEILHGLRVQPYAVHGTAVQVGYLLLDTSLLGVLEGCHAVYEGSQLYVVVFLQGIKRTIAGVLGGQRVGFLPASRGVHVEVCAHLIGGVQVTQVYT